MRIDHFALKALLPLSLAIGVADPARADFTNGGFETGTFAGWSTSGDTGVFGPAGSVAPPGGAFQAAATTTDDPLSVNQGTPPGTPVAALETFFGLAPGSFRAIRSPNATGGVLSGAGFYQDVTVAVGDTLSFSWDFLTQEPSNATIDNDFSFVVIGGAASRLIAANDSVNGPLSGPTVTIGRDSFRSSGYRTFTTSFTSAGIVRIGVGAINVGDNVTSSMLLADNFVITSLVAPAIPEPATWMMLITGFGAVGGAMRRRAAWTGATA